MAAGKSIVGPLLEEEARQFYKDLLARNNMKGYLLKEQQFTAGEDTFIDSDSSENNYAVVFEDDTETGYFYALK